MAKKKEAPLPECSVPEFQRQEGMTCLFCGMDLERVREWSHNYGFVDFGYLKHSTCLEGCVKVLASQVQQLMAFKKRVEGCSG